MKYVASAHDVIWEHRVLPSHFSQEEARFAEVTGTGNAGPVYYPTQPNELVYGACKGL